MVTNTSSSSYWSPLRPRIRLFEFADKTYASPLYSYDAFSDVGSEVKPIALSFDSQITSVGDFSIEIEDSESTLDPDVFMKGNRVFIECSKDGITWQPAFKGLVRSSEQKLYARTGRNFILRGYSYLIRLNERVVNTIKESSLVGDDYDRTDSDMFTHNLINDLLTTDSNYIHSVDDTQLYDIFQTNNILSSPIVEWIPRLDAQLVTVGAAIDRVLDFSNGLVMFNPADDELMLYTADLVTPAVGTFLITNHMNENADDADYTMYPLEPYSYNVSYDYPDSGSRLIASIGNSACPAVETFPNPKLANVDSRAVSFQVSGTDRWLAPAVQFPTNVIRNLAITLQAVGNNSTYSTLTARVYNNNNISGMGTFGTQVGSNMTLYHKAEVGTPFPSVSTHTVVASMLPGDIGPTVVPWLWYYMAVKPDYDQTTSNHLQWRGESPVQLNHLTSRYYTSTDGTTFNFLPGNAYLPGGEDFAEPEHIYHGWKWDLSFGGLNPCGGIQSQLDTDPVFCVAQDNNMSGRLGVVERVISNIPTHVKTSQTLNEYLFNTLYFSAKPRFTFDFPSLSMPNKLPKAGDIVSHVDTRANVGLNNSPIQTGVINTIRYSFQQGQTMNDVLGLRKLLLSTTGIKRGSY